MADVRIKPWHISLDGPVSEYSESLFAVGNGCLGMRGFSLQTPKRRPYDHAVFRAGFFEPIRPGVTDMVQLPDALGCAWWGGTRTGFAGTGPAHLGYSPNAGAGGPWPWRRSAWPAWRTGSCSVCA